MLIRNLKVSGVLSFGAKGIDLPLRPLNVLIGANGSGKSNFIEIINLLRYMPTRLDSPIMSSGGMGEWLYGGAEGFNIEPPLVKIEAVVEKRKGQVMGLRHSIVLFPKGDYPTVDDETIENESTIGNDPEPRWFYRMNGGSGMLNEGTAGTDGDVRILDSATLDSRASIRGPRSSRSYAIQTGSRNSSFYKKPIPASRFTANGALAREPWRAPRHRPTPQSIRSDAEARTLQP